MLKITCSFCVLCLTFAGSAGAGEQAAASGGWGGIRQLLGVSSAWAKSEMFAVKAEAEFVLGSPDAPLTLVGFTDYQCPFCGRFENETLPELHKKFIASGKLRFIRRDLPLSSHPFALQAAEAVRCAGEQGKYWEMSAKVFGNQNLLDKTTLEAHATWLALDSEIFMSCLADGKHRSAIAIEAAAAHAEGIHKTPSFVLGKVVGDQVQGRLIVGAQPLSVFETAIAKMLEQ